MSLVNGSNMSLETLAALLHMAWEQSYPRPHPRPLAFDEIGNLERQRWIQVARAAAHNLAEGVSCEIGRQMGWPE